MQLQPMKMQPLQICCNTQCSFIKDITVDYATADSTATAGADYTAGFRNYNYRWLEQLQQTIPVAVLSDSMDEDDEIVHVNLSNATNASIADAQGALTITDDDATPSLVYC